MDGRSRPARDLARALLFQVGMPSALESLRDQIIDQCLAFAPRAEEGAVGSVGAPSYRRLDVGGRALAYLRLHRKTQPRVRVDVAGWFGPVQDGWARPCAGGAATLWVGNEAEAASAARLLAALASGVTEGPEHEEHQHPGHGDVQPKREGIA